MKIIATILVLAVSSASLACEVCGCGASGGTIGNIGASKAHLLGFSFQGRYFNSAHPALFSDAIERSQEQFLATALVGKYQIHKRWQLLASIPVHFNRQSKNGIQTFSNGFGDVSAHIRFAPIFRQDSIRRRALILQVGTGIKAPTGQYSREAHETSNLYPGTGSWDIPLDLNLYIIRDRWMFQFENALTLKTENKIGYRYGHALQSTLFGQQTWGQNSFKFSTGIGIQGEYLQSDRIQGSAESTINGGYLISIVPGINLEWKQFFAVGRYQFPVSQHLSKGYTTAKGQFVASVYYTFN